MSSQRVSHTVSFFADCVNLNKAMITAMNQRSQRAELRS